MTITVLGIFVADASFRAARQPAVGETLIGSGFGLGPGGKGSNQAIGIALLGGEVHLISKIGQDPFGDMALKVWQEAGVIPSVERTADVPTGAAGIFVDEKSGDNAIIVCPGASGTLSVEDIDARADLIANSSHFITQLEQSAEVATYALRIAKEARTATVLNPAPAADLAAEVYSLCDYVTPNEAEAEGLTGIEVRDLETAEKAADELIRKGVGTAIITLGENGAFWKSSSGGQGHCPAFTELGPVVETTGAGDAFNAGLVTALSEGQSIEDAVRFGCAVAGLSVTRAGAASSMPSGAEVEVVLASC